MTMLPAVNGPVLNPVTLTGYPVGMIDLPDVQPYTQRSAMGLLGTLESLRTWTVNVLAAHVDSGFTLLTATWQDQVTQLLDAVQSALDTQASNVTDVLNTAQTSITQEAQDAVNASAQALLASADASTDPAIMAVLNNLNSLTRKFFDNTYLKSDTADVDVAVKSAFTTANSQSLGYLDQRYQGQVFNDAALDLILENSTSASREFLEGRFLADTADSVDPAVLAGLERVGSQSLTLLDGRYLGVAPKDISSTDLNGITKSGNYTGSTLTNAPNGQTGMFLISVIYLDSNNQVQFAESLAENFEYRRQKSGGTWGTWRRLVENSLAVSTALPTVGAARSRCYLTDIGIEIISTGTVWQVTDSQVTLTSAQRTALPTTILKNGLLVVESDTTKTYKWVNSTIGWVLWDSGDAGWTNIPYASGYSNGSGGTQDSLSWIVRNGTMHLRGIANGTFANSTSVTISGTWTPPSAKYLPGTGKVKFFPVAAGSAGKFGVGSIDANGVIQFIWNNGGTTYAAPTYTVFAASLPYGSDS